MSGTYKAIGGEDWNMVARATTGNDIDADKIRQANPGMPIPLRPGMTVQIPEILESVPVDLDDVSIIVNGQQIKTFDDLEIAFSIDAITKATFTVPNEIETRSIFKPLSSPMVTIGVNGNVLLTGRCESPEPVSGGNKRTLKISCYSSPGILERCHRPLTAFPFEWTNANLLQIANELCLPHGVACVFQAPPGALFERVDIQPGTSILDFISELAQQRGPVMTSDAMGQLIVWTGVAAGSPVAQLKKGTPPVEDLNLVIDESKYYSSVTGYIPAKTKRRGLKALGRSFEFTVRNPHATDIVRPYEMEFTDIGEGELVVAVNTLAGRMFADIVSVDAELTTWFDDNGAVYTPNTTLTVESEEDFISVPYEFLIADVTLRITAEAQTASLRLTLPGVYSGIIPAVLPWQ